jgi:hypothetical protein
LSATTASGLTGWLRSTFVTLRHYHRLAEVGAIARRYFAMNAFDGVLTTLGVLVGSYIGHVHSAHQVIAVGLGAAKRSPCRASKTPTSRRPRPTPRSSSPSSTVCRRSSRRSSC